MTRNAYIFMDFDGVTHPWGEVEDFHCLPHIEAVVREFPEAWKTIGCGLGRMHS